jgi:hypothetical protein
VCSSDLVFGIYLAVVLLRPRGLVGKQ